jgi:hypothetical protein
MSTEMIRREEQDRANKDTLFMARRCGPGRGRSRIDSNQPDRQKIYGTARIGRPDRAGSYRTSNDILNCGPCKLDAGWRYVGLQQKYLFVDG